MTSLYGPGPTDAVLGNLAPSPADGLVLGGLEGVRQRLHSAIATERLAALWTAQTYGEAGIQLILQALDDPTLRKAAYALLRYHPDPAVQQQIERCSPYPFIDCLHILRGHQGGITAIALSADGQTLISSSRDRTIKGWDVESREERFTVDVRSLVFSLTLDSDDQVFIAKYSDQALTLHSVRNGLPLEVSPWEDEPEVRPRTIASVTTGDRQTLISSSQNTIRIWDLRQGRELMVLRGHTSLVTAVAVSPQIPLIASGSEDKTIRIWGLEPFPVGA